MFLKDYIEEFCGDDYLEAYRLLSMKFGVSERTIKSWRLLERVPSVEVARAIVRRTAGAVDYKDIYAPYKRKRGRPRGSRDSYLRSRRK